MAFTNSKIKNIKPGKTRKIVWEDGQTCLGLKFSPQGNKTFIFTYRFEGRPRMYTIGRYPATSLADARIRLAEGKSQLTKGTDPG